MKPPFLIVLVGGIVGIVGARSGFALEGPEIGTWAAPPYWLRPVAALAPEVGESPSHLLKKAVATSSSPLPFVAITPCRQYDSRSASVLTQATPRTVPVTGAPCAIPPSAEAVAANITVFDISGAAGNGVFKVGTASPPTTAWINYPPTETQRANAGVLPLGAGGTIVVQVNQGAGSVDFVVDVFGYYSPLGVVNSVNTLSGAVTLAPGSNISITPGGANTLTITNTGGGGGGLPLGLAGQTLRHNGSAWAANGALTSDGANVAIGGSLDLPMPASVTAGLERLLTADMNHNLFLGRSSGVAISTGYQNTALGSSALTAATSAHDNTAVGWQALGNTGIGILNTAVGSGALFISSSGSLNVAVGANALHATTSDENTAVGAAALSMNGAGLRNTAVGGSSLSQNVSGSFNTAVGHSSLMMSTGEQNTAVGYLSAGSTTSGFENTAVGSGALANNQIGSGNVAIGQVAGRDVLGSGNVLVGFSAGSSETGSNRLYIANGSAGSALIYGQFDNGRVGINNQALTNAALEVTPKISGDIAIRGSSAAGTGVYGKSAAAGFSGVFGSNDSSGYGVYGLSISGYSVYCNGNGGYTGSWGLISDGRLKRDVEPLEDGLRRVLALRGVRFLYRVDEFPEKKLPREPQIGFIAQEVEEIVPSVVVTGPDGYKSVDYAKLTPLLVEALKAQQDEIRDLKVKVRSLEALTVRLERLEASIPEVR